MTQPRIYSFPTAEITAQRFGDYLIEKARGREIFNCALSGGSTPKLLFDYLAQKYPEPYHWEHIHLYWGDERCVPPSHAESNYLMTKEALLDKVQIPAGNIHRVRGEDDPAKEAKRYADVLTQRLPEHNFAPVFDLVILGMGTDGHTASIFPHQMELLQSEEICAVATHPESGQQRVTLTGKVINHAKEVIFLVTGANKKEKIHEILHQTGNWESYPASHIAPEDGELVWFVDDAALGR